MGTDTHMTHEISFDENDGILICRLHGFLHDDAAQLFGRDLAEAAAGARRHNRPLLFLVDNREGSVVSPVAAAALADQLNASKQPGDRTAIIVSDSLSKLQAKRVTTTEHDVFVSEAEARAWLTADVKGAG